MTTSYLDTAPVIDLARTSLRSSARAWDDALAAALEHDARRARQVLRRDAARRSGLRSARRRLDQLGATGTLGSLRLVVHDLWRLDRLLSQLAQDVLGPGGGVPGDCRAAVDLLRTTGAGRLLDLADGWPDVPVDSGYVRQGQGLVRAWTGLHEQRAGEAAVCARLAAVLVETSRHASGTV